MVLPRFQNMFSTSYHQYRLSQEWHWLGSDAAALGNSPSRRQHCLLSFVVLFVNQVPVAGVVYWPRRENMPELQRRMERKWSRHFDLIQFS